MSAAERGVYDRVVRHWPPPSHVVLRQVRDSPGSAYTRTADALVVGIWPSVGLHLQGVEIKTTRGDWLREVRRPEKAEPIMRYCDRWWAAVADERIVEPGELPEGWGLLVCDGLFGSTGMRTVVEAPLLDPLPAPRTFLAALVRAAAS